MPRALVATAPRQPAIVTYEEPPLGARDVRLRTEFAAPKHGTELNLYRGYQRVMEWAFDPRLGCFAPRNAAAVQAMFPRPLGNMAAGVVTEVGAEVTRFRPGDRAFGHLPIRETQTADADLLPCGEPPPARRAGLDAGAHVPNLPGLAGQRPLANRRYGLAGRAVRRLGRRLPGD